VTRESARAVSEGGIKRKEPENKGLFEIAGRKGWFHKLTSQKRAALKWFVPCFAWF
jgi:hypothetical protein